MRRQRWRKEAVNHAPISRLSRAPPPVAEPPPNRWAQMPAANRARLLWLLSRLAERRWRANQALREEGEDEHADLHQ